MTAAPTLAPPRRLVKGPALLAELWPDAKDRPSLRTLSRWQDAREIPFVKLGGLIFFDPDQVRETIAARKTIYARKLPL